VGKSRQELLPAGRLQKYLNRDLGNTLRSRLSRPEELRQVKNTVTTIIKKKREIGEKLYSYVGLLSLAHT
jgi:hypothetical protein